MIILIVHNTIVCNIYHLAVFKYLQKDNQNQYIYLTYNIFLIYLSLCHTNNVIIYIKFSITCFFYMVIVCRHTSLLFLIFCLFLHIAISFILQLNYHKKSFKSNYHKTTLTTQMNTFI